MKVKRYQNGGSDPIRQRLERERLAADRAGIRQAASEQGLTISGDQVFETPFPSGAITARPDLMAELLLISREAPQLAKGIVSALKNPKATAESIKSALRSVDDFLSNRPPTSSYKVYPRQPVSSGTRIDGPVDPNFIQQQDFLNNMVKDFGDLTPYGLSDKYVKDTLNSILKKTSGEVDQITKIRKAQKGRDYLDPFEVREVYHTFQDNILKEMGEEKAKEYLANRSLSSANIAERLDPNYLELVYGGKPGSPEAVNFMIPRMAKAALDPSDNRYIGPMSAVYRPGAAGKRQLYRFGQQPGGKDLPPPVSMNAKGGKIKVVKKYQNGGSDPIRQRLQRERLSEVVQRMLDSGNFKKKVFRKSR